MSGLLAALSAYLAGLSDRERDMKTSHEIAELEALLSDDAPVAAHYACNHCWDGKVPAVAFCGTTLRRPSPQSGVHICAKCIALDAASPLPCGHP